MDTLTLETAVHLTSAGQCAANAGGINSMNKARDRRDGSAISCRLVCSPQVETPMALLAEVPSSKNFRQHRLWSLLGTGSIVDLIVFVTWLS
jgi:hypothetical protein